VQVHDDRAIFRSSPDELPVIDIHSLCQTSAARRRSPGNGRLGRGLCRCDTNATAGGAERFKKPAPDALAAPPEAHESLIRR